MTLATGTPMLWLHTSKPKMPNFSKLIEAQIAKARAQGQLENLEGEGKPLPHHDPNAFVDAGDAVGMRIMAKAKVVPEEIRLKKEIAKLYA